MTNPTNDPWNEIRFNSQDGLSLCVRHYNAKSESTDKALPLICLPGLTRNAKDFDVLAEHLSSKSETPREIYCVDYRGRGQSDHDKNWENYSPYIEMLDVLDFMSVAEIERAAFLGTSRGGIIAMLLGVTRPSAIGPVILNDIGPVIEARGLARIMGYVGRTPAPENWDDAALLVKDMSQRFFTNLKDDDWMAIARQWFMEEDGRPVAGYDPKLSKTLSQIDLAEPIPEMWEQFDSLKHVPMLVLRGDLSDLLSAETVKTMMERHPSCSSYLVEYEGHAPLLRDRRSIGQIDSFLQANTAH